jgi:hypothetical protein
MVKQVHLSADTMKMKEVIPTTVNDLKGKL